MRILLLVFATLVLLAVPLCAQTPTPPELTGKFAGVGIGLFPAGNPQIQGMGFLALPISPKVLSFTNYDVAALPGTPVPGQKITFPRLQFSMRTGAAVLAYKFSDRVSLWGLAGAGVAATGENVVGSFGGGGFVDIAFGKGLGLVLIVEAARNAITGTEFNPRLALRKKF